MKWGKLLVIWFDDQMYKKVLLNHLIIQTELHSIFKTLKECGGSKATFTADNYLKLVDANPLIPEIAVRYSLSLSN